MKNLLEGNDKVYKIMNKINFKGGKTRILCARINDTSVKIFNETGINNVFYKFNLKLFSARMDIKQSLACLKNCRKLYCKFDKLPDK